MRSIAPKNFRFSPLITVISILLAVLMLKASFWQWERYNYKVKLLQSYEQNSRDIAQKLPGDWAKTSDFTEVLHRRVKVSGRYDFSRQILIANRRHQSGPGFWLVTPLRIEKSDQSILVSRGFIPFADRDQRKWEKYSFAQEEQLEAVVQESIPHRVFLAPKSSAAKSNAEFQRVWLYPDLEKIAEQFPYPIISAVFLQRLGGPPYGQFPAESVSVRVPPSTHFGYTIEWALLALSSLILGFLLQAFPRRKKHRGISSKERLLCTSVILLFFLPLAGFATEQAKQVPRKAEIIERLNEKVDLSLEFKDENDKKIKLAELLSGELPLVIAPVYYECPRLCSLTQQGLVDGLKQLELKLGKEFRVASISFNPKESAEQALQKAQKYRSLLNSAEHKPGQWRFLRGTKRNTKKLMKQLGFSYEEDRGEYIHSAVLMLITPSGRISRYLYGIKFPQANLKLAILEAGEGKIGSTLQRVLLYCFRYDHIQGKFTPAILKITRLLCGGFFVILMSFLLILRLRE